MLSSTNFGYVLQSSCLLRLFKENIHFPHVFGYLFPEIANEVGGDR